MKLAPCLPTASIQAKLGSMVVLGTKVAHDFRARKSRPVGQPGDPTRCQASTRPPSGAAASFSPAIAHAQAPSPITRYFAMTGQLALLNDDWLLSTKMSGAHGKLRPG